MSHAMEDGFSSEATGSEDSGSSRRGIIGFLEEFHRTWGKENVPGDPWKMNRGKSPPLSPTSLLRLQKFLRFL